MTEIIVEIGGIEVSNDRETFLKTYALGSCVAVIVFDSSTKTAGMVHVALSESSINPGKAKKSPGYFTDTALPELLNRMKKIAPLLEKDKLVVKIAGGANICDDKNFLNIGQRNISSIKKFFHDNGMKIQNEDVGGSIYRTVKIDVINGKITVSNYNKGEWEL